MISDGEILGFKGNRPSIISHLLMQNKSPATFKYYRGVNQLFSQFGTNYPVTLSNLVFYIHISSAGRLID
jgi:hypothetical protein